MHKLKPDQFALAKHLFNEQSETHFSSEIWDNPFSRRHARQNLRFKQLRFTDWQTHIPEDFQLVALKDIL